MRSGATFVWSGLFPFVKRDIRPGHVDLASKPFEGQGKNKAR